MWAQKPTKHWLIGLKIWKVLHIIEINHIIYFISATVCRNLMPNRLCGFDINNGWIRKSRRPWKEDLHQYQWKFHVFWILKRTLTCLLAKRRHFTKYQCGGKKAFTRSGYWIRGGTAVAPRRTKTARWRVRGSNAIHQIQRLSLLVPQDVWAIKVISTSQ